MSFFEQIVQTVAAPALVGTRMLTKAIAPVLDPVVGRLQSSGLLGINGLGLGNSIKKPFNVQFNSGSDASDWKVRIRIGDTSRILYKSGLGGVLNPLTQTGGVVFPYTPNITVAYQGNYSPQRFTHSNYAHYSYDNSEVQTIQIQADFTAQNQEEADYVLACIYFFRATTKMFFGQGEFAGYPPPLVFLSGYGKHYFPDVPCIVLSFSHTMPSEVDYIETSGANGGINFQPSTGAGEFGEEPRLGGSGGSGGRTRIPTMSTFSIGLQPVYSKESLTKFDLNEFAQGKLVEGRFI
jgi:hypothetical protein